jgi:hypothetical protein
VGRIVQTKEKQIMRITYEQVQEILKELKVRGKLNAVKMLRYYIPMGLREAVNFLERNDLEEILLSLCDKPQENKPCPLCGHTKESEK